MQSKRTRSRAKKSKSFEWTKKAYVELLDLTQVYGYHQFTKVATDMRSNHPTITPEIVRSKLRADKVIADLKKRGVEIEDDDDEGNLWR